MTTRRRKKHRLEEIIAKLRDADPMLNAGKDPAAVRRALEVSESTRERWRARHRREAVVGNGHAGDRASPRSLSSNTVKRPSQRQAAAASI